MAIISSAIYEMYEMYVCVPNLYVDMYCTYVCSMNYND